MTEQDREAFGMLMGSLAELFPMELTPGVLAMYWKTLSDLDIRTVERAVVEATRISSFFPKPAELRKCAFTKSPRPWGIGPRRLEYRQDTTKHGFEATALVTRILNGDLAGRRNIAARVRALWDMHARWPEYGWDEAAENAEDLQDKYVGWAEKEKANG